MERPMHRGLRWVPATKPGRAALGSLALFFAVIGLVMVLVQVAGWQDERGAAAEIVLGACGVVALVSGVSAAALSAFAVVFRHERSILIWPVLVIGGFVLFLVGGEIVVPH